MPQANKRASGHRISKSIFLRLSLGLTAKGESLGQVLGYNGCYDSGTCPRDYTPRDYIKTGTHTQVPVPMTWSEV